MSMMLLDGVSVRECLLWTCFTWRQAAQLPWCNVDTFKCVCLICIINISTIQVISCPHYMYMWQMWTLQLGKQTAEWETAGRDAFLFMPEPNHDHERSSHTHKIDSYYNENVKLQQIKCKLYLWWAEMCIPRIYYGDWVATWSHYQAYNRN